MARCDLCSSKRLVMLQFVSKTLRLVSLRVSQRVDQSSYQNFLDFSLSVRRVTKPEADRQMSE